MSDTVNVALPYSAHGQVTLGNSTRIHYYDFTLRPEELCMELADLNGFWLCCGKDPAHRFAGAWLLAPGARVLALHPRVVHTKFNKRERKTYAWLYFLDDRECSPFLDVRAAPPLRVRVALCDERTNGDLFLLATGRGETYDITERASYDNEELASKVWLYNEDGLCNEQRWVPDMCVVPPRPSPPRQQQNFGPPRHQHVQQVQQVQHVNTANMYDAPAPVQRPAPAPRPAATQLPDEYDPSVPMPFFPPP